MIQKGLLWCLLFLGLSIGVAAQELSFTAHASAQKVGTKDRLQVTFTISNAPNASNFQPPSFAGFSITGGPFQSNQTSYNNANGRTQQTSSITLTYVLVPNKTGMVTIDPAKIEVSGKTLASNPISVQVVNGSLAPAQPQQNRADPFDDPFAAMQQYRQMMRQEMEEARRRGEEGRRQPPNAAINDPNTLGEKDIDKNIFIRVEVDKTQPYVGEQITVSYKLYTRLPMSVSLTQLPSLNGFWSQDFQIPNPPKAKEETVNGLPYQVFLLKKTALFPQQAGDLELDAAKAEGIVRILQQQRGRHPFADDPFASFFMDDPFFNQDAFIGYNYKDVNVKLSSKPIRIQVKPLPVSNRPATFTGGVGKFKVEAVLDKDQLTTDEATTLTFTVTGSGNLKLIGNPVAEFPPELGIYDPTTNDTITSRNPDITGSKSFHYSVNPQSAGTFVIPAIPFSYYDVSSGQYITLRSEPIKIFVKAGKNKAAVSSSLPKDIHGIRPLLALQKAPTPFLKAGGYWALYGLSLMAFVGLWLWKRQKDRYASDQALLRRTKANKIAWKRLATAKKLLSQERHMDFYEEISKAIWLYVSDKLGIPLSNLSKETLASELGKRNIPPSLSQATEKLILECEVALYSPAGGQSQRQHTIDEAAQIIAGLETNLKKQKQA